MSQSRLRSLVLVAAAALASLVPFLAYADSWMLPTERAYLASDGSARLTVTPRDLESQLAYFDDKIEGREPAGQRSASDRTTARGKLELRGADGRWRVAWQGPLVNEVSPVDALVASGGRHFVTFDNWHSTGFGENVVVIYDRAGRLVRSLQLSDFLPRYVIDALPRSVSSMQWSGTHRFSADGRRLLLQIVQPGQTLSASEEDRRYFEVAVELSSGQIISPAGADWESAKTSACQVLASNVEYSRRRHVFLRDPLVGPSNSVEPDWHEYLREAFLRLDSQWRDSSASTTVLRSRSAPDYAQSEPWVAETLQEPALPGEARMFASPDQAQLAAILRRDGSRVRRDSLRGVTLYIALVDNFWPAVTSALSASGARLVQVDPTEPIPQRSERMPPRSELIVLPPECGGLAVRDTRGARAAALAMAIVALGGAFLGLRRGVVHKT